MAGPTDAFICPNHPWIWMTEPTTHKFVDGSWQDVPNTCPIDHATLESVPIPDVTPAGSGRVTIVSDEGDIRTILEENAAGTQGPGPGYMRKDWAQRFLDQLNKHTIVRNADGTFSEWTDGALRSFAFEKNFSGTPVLVWGDTLITMPQHP